jgi:S-adenosylmethionine-diacylglycerol 3-amino-3-carboxypropyl transferase
MNTNLIRYSQCWEDTDLLLEHAGNLQDKKILSIASAGDNSLALLSGNPQNLVAIDLCRAQIAVTWLKVIAMRHLEREDFIAFIGAAPSSERQRLAIYDAIRGDTRLPARYRQYLDDRRKMISRGIIHSGKLERYFALYRRIVTFLHGQSLIDKACASLPLQVRLSFYQDEFCNLPYKMLQKAFFSTYCLKSLGRERAFFRYCSGDLAHMVAHRTRAALNNPQAHNNPYLYFILKGTYKDGSAMPFYLRKQNYDRIKANLDRLEIVESALDLYLGKHAENFQNFDLFNLSDIFEYMDSDESFRLSRLLADSSNRGARHIYWNMMVPRSMHAPGLQSQTVLQADEEFAKIGSFFYRAFKVDVVDHAA